MKKLDLRVQKTYKSLVDTLIKLMGEKSFENITVSEICDRAGVHRATFYKHFKDKNEFFKFCFDSNLSQIKFKAAEKEAPTVDNIKDSFMSFIVEIFEFIKKNRAVFSVICSEQYAFSLGASFTGAVNAYCYEKIRIVLPEASDERAQLFASFYSSAFIGIVKWYASNGAEYPLDEMYSFLEARVDELCDTYLKRYNQ